MRKPLKSIVRLDVREPLVSIVRMDVVLHSLLSMSSVGM